MASDGGSETRLDPGAYLFREGDRADDAYLVESGTLEVLTRGADGSVPIARLGPGDLVGELALLAGGHRTAGVRAAEPSVLRRLTRTDLETMLDSDPGLARRVADETLRRLDETSLAKVLADLTADVPVPLFERFASSAEMVRLPAGAVLPDDGDGTAYLVVSGRLARFSRDGRRTSDVGRGGLIGDFGLVDGIGVGRDSMRAMRDSTVARIRREVFDDLVADHPRPMLDIARGLLARSSGPSRAGAGVVTALVVTGGLDRDRWVRSFAGALGSSVALVSAARVDRDLSTPGIASAEPGSPQEYRLLEYLHGMEVDHDHVVLDVGTDAVWAGRALGYADRVVVVVDASRSGRNAAVTWSEAIPESALTTLVLVHEVGAAAPTHSGSARLEAGADRIMHVRSDSDIARVARVVTGRSTALVFSGGGARGFAHIGAYRALWEAGVEIDVVGGSSVGSTAAVAVALGLDPDGMQEVMREGFRAVLDYTVPLVSLVKGGRITRAIRSAVGDLEIEDLWKPYLCVSTNLTTSRPEIHTSGPLDVAVRASVAIPGVLPPVPSQGNLLVDGGLMDNLPIAPVRRHFAPETVIAVDVAPPRGPRARTDYGLSVSGWTALRSRMVGRRHHPGITSVLLRSMIAAAAQQRDKYVADDLADLVLALDLRGVGMLEFDQVDRVAKAGYEAAAPVVEQWLAGRSGTAD